MQQSNLGRKSKIAILANFPLAALENHLLGRKGGNFATWLPQLAKHLEKHEEYDIHWVCLNRKKIKNVTLQQWGQTFHFVAAFPLKVDLITRYFSARWILRRVLKRIKPDLVHAWGTESVYPSILSKFKKPSILSMQGVLTNLQKVGGLNNSRRWRTMVKSEPKFLKAATVVTCESSWAVDRVKEVCPDLKTKIVEYGVHPSFYDLKWSPDTNNPYCVYVGCDGYAKGIPVLVEAMNRIGDSKNWKLKLAGINHTSVDLEKSSTENIEALGSLNWTDLQKLLCGAQCLVLPTLADSSPNAVKEARVIGLPIITTKDGGQSGYVQHQENGIIINPLNAENLKAGLLVMMDDLDLAKKMGGCHHQRDRDYFESVRTADNFTKIYKELLSSSS